jgi:hypothetical protein
LTSVPTGFFLFIPIRKQEKLLKIRRSQRERESLIIELRLSYTRGALFIKVQKLSSRCEQGDRIAAGEWAVSTGTPLIATNDEMTGESFPLEKSPPVSFLGGFLPGVLKKIMAEKGESGKVKRKIVKIHFFVLSLEKEKKNNKRDGQTHPWAGGAVVGGWVD